MEMPSNLPEDQQVTNPPYDKLVIKRLCSIEMMDCLVLPMKEIASNTSVVGNTYDLKTLFD
jgi:hypothetical protein